MHPLNVKQNYNPSIHKCNLYKLAQGLQKNHSMGEVKKEIKTLHQKQVYLNMNAQYKAKPLIHTKTPHELQRLQMLYSQVEMQYSFSAIQDLVYNGEEGLSL